MFIYFIIYLESKVPKIPIIITYDISASFLRETTIGVSYFYGNVNKTKSQSRLEAL